MKITDSIKIDWHHDVPKKTTSCVLTVNETEHIAIAKCGHGDQFSRKAGRKLTLSRVLAKSGLGKADRTNIWAVIWSRGVKV